MSLIVPPYPPARYTKDEPEVSARLRLGTDPPDYDSFGLVKYHYLANQQATDGDYGLYRVAHVVGLQTKRTRCRVGWLATWA